MPLLPVPVIIFGIIILLALGGWDVLVWLWDHRSGIWTGIVWTTLVIILVGLSERLSRIK